MTIRIYPHAVSKDPKSPDRTIPAAARRLGEQRRGERQEAFARAQQRHTITARMSGGYALGRDENGAMQETKRLEEFKIFADRWYVRMPFKREDAKKLERRSVQQVEAALKNGRVPRATVHLSTHIVTAVRLLKHIAQGYQNEMAAAEGYLRGLDLRTVQFARSRAHTPEEIEKLIGELKAFDAQVLEGKEVAVKKIVARARVADAINRLEQALAGPNSKREFGVSQALAVLTSARERLGKWRDRQIAGLMGYNRQKEWAMRLERDRWVYSQLVRFAQNPKQIYEYILADAKKLEVLAEIRKKLDGGEPTQEILGYIIAGYPHFKVAERKQEGAERYVAAIDEGTMRKPWAQNIDYLIGHYRWLYRFVRDGEKEKMMEKIDYLQLFVNANKPRFVLHELEKTDDPYLRPVVDEMARAVEALEGQNFKQSKAHFQSAADRLLLMIGPAP